MPRGLLPSIRFLAAQKETCRVPKAINKYSYQGSAHFPTPLGAMNWNTEEKNLRCGSPGHNPGFSVGLGELDMLPTPHLAFCLNARSPSLWPCAGGHKQLLKKTQHHPQKQFHWDSIDKGLYILSLHILMSLETNICLYKSLIFSLKKFTPI